jgi:hypothetical protein
MLDAGEQKRYVEKSFSLELVDMIPASSVGTRVFAATGVNIRNVRVP